MNNKPGMDYEEEKRLAADKDAARRRLVASNASAHPEVLYFLAEDPDPEVRREIANNRMTPRQADLILSKDRDESVRQLLASKIGRLVPSLSKEAKAHIRDLTIEILENLARDEAVRVREVVAETLKDLTQAPAYVIQELARDVEIRVAGPVLQNSPILSDEDLLEIIGSGPIKGALAAISGRDKVGQRLADAIVEAAIDVPHEADAIAALLKNESAQIREETLDIILDRAPERPQWHAPLVERPKLPKGAIKRMAEFVSTALLDILQARPDLDPTTAKAVAAQVERRLSPDMAAQGAAKAPVGPPRPESLPSGEEAISAAIAANKTDLVVGALARDSGLPIAIVKKIIGSMSAKAVTALAWRAKFTMRQAHQIQLKIAGIPPQQMLNPRGGSDYPLSESEMEWQLELFTGE